MTQQQAEQLADELKRLVFKRTGLDPENLMCPREKSAMTPCAARDGKLVAIVDSHGNALCVGCEAHLQQLVDRER